MRIKQCAMNYGLLVGALTASHTLAAMYQIDSLGSLAPLSRGVYDYRGYSLNNVGQVLGQTLVSGNTQASIWQSGQIQALGVFGGGSTSKGYAINDNCDVAAELNDGFQNLFAAVKRSGQSWISGAYSSGIHFTTPRGLNSSGQMVGIASTATILSPPLEAMYHPPVDGKTIPILIPLPSFPAGASGDSAFDISDNGFIAGNAVFNNSNTSTRATVWQYVSNTQINLMFIDVVDALGSTALDVNQNDIAVGYTAVGAAEWNTRGINVLAGTPGIATGINESGVVVGDTAIPPTPTATNSRAFVDFPNQPVQDLNSLLPPNSGWTLYTASAINNSGQIVGYGSLGGYLLTPIPEPAVGMTAVFLLCATCLKRSRRRHV